MSSTYTCRLGMYKSVYLSILTAGWYVGNPALSSAPTGRDLVPMRRRIGTDKDT